MLIIHPNIYLDASGRSTHALLVRDAKVAAVGDNAVHAASSDDETIKPDGKCVMPALIDAHIHLWGLGIRGGTVDLRGLDADEALDALADAAPQSEGWIFGTNLDEHQFEPDQQLTRSALDRLFPERPVRIQRVDRHAIWVNSTALKRAGVDHDFRCGPDGHAARDDDGALTGYLVDAAMTPVLAAIPETTLAEDRQALLESAARLRAQGVGACTIARCPATHVEMLKELADGGDLPLRIDALVAGTDDGLADIVAQGPIDDPGRGLRIAGVKFYADGALGSAGAHLLSPYRQGGRGLAMHDPAFLMREIPRLMNAGWQVAVHAIGDAAARHVLDAFEAVPDSIRTDLRPRLEHAQMVAPADQRRFAELDVVASIQPIHLRSDAPWAATKLDDDQLEHLFPWRSLMPAILAAGSDYPIDDLNPWHGMATAITRRGADGVPFGPQQSLSLEEILDAYTRGAAFASHREARLGSLHPGYIADMAVLDTDPFQATPDEIWNIKAHLVSTLSTVNDATT